MDINVIYDDRINFNDKDRLIKEFERVGIKSYTFWDAVLDQKIVVDNIAQSHKNIVFDAKEKGLPCVLIAEQDLFFPNINGWKYFLENIPDVYDCYIGGSYLIDNRVEYKAPIIRVNEWVGNHLILINERYYDTWLSTPLNSHIDSAQSGKGEFYVCFPYPALQNPSKSANNNHQLVNYNDILPENYIYK